MKGYRKRVREGQNVRECQLTLARELKKLCGRLSKTYPGVWRAVAIDDLLVIAEELPLMAEKGIDARILMWWQPRLIPDELLYTDTPEPPTWTDNEGMTHAYAPDDYDGLGICPNCHDRYTTSGQRLCTTCAQQEMIDNHLST